MAEPHPHRPIPGPMVALTSLWAFSLTGLVTAGLILSLEQAATYHCSDTLGDVCRASWLSARLPIFDCDVLSQSPLAHPFDAPLPLYAAAYYLVNLLLCLTLLVTRANTPFRNAIEWVVATFGTVLFLITLGLVGYSAIEFHAICRVCLLFYVINTALTLATRLLVPRRRARRGRRSERPLQGELNRYTDRALALLLAVLALFAVSAVARAMYLRWDHHLRTHPEESRCPNFPAPTTTPSLQLGPFDRTHHRVMAIIDPACTKCRREWPEMQRWAEGMPLHVYLNPQDEACDLEGTERIHGIQASREYRSCQASKALWCMGQRHPERSREYLARLYDLQGEVATDERLLYEATGVGLSSDQVQQLRACIDAKSTLHAIAAQRQVATDVGATGTPFIARLHGAVGYEFPRDPHVRQKILDSLQEKK